MGTYLAARFLTASLTISQHAAMFTAAASTEGDSTVKAAIISGIFGLLVAFVTAAAMYFRNRGPDVSELLDVHERLAVIETNQADMRDDIRTLLNRTRRDR